MAVSVVEAAIDVPPEYGEVPIAFLVRSQLRVERSPGGLEGIWLVEEWVEPYLKVYDAYRGEGPVRWSERFDVLRWGVPSAFDGPRRIGGAVLAWDTPGVNMLEDRHDLVVFWDLQVHPDHRGRGAGRRLFDRVVV